MFIMHALGRLGVSNVGVDSSSSSNYNNNINDDNTDDMRLSLGLLAEADSSPVCWWRCCGATLEPQNLQALLLFS